jgi:epoxyqueuosine reductase
MNNLKSIVNESASALGFSRCVIGSLEPMDSELAEFERWLKRGYAAGMEYLKRNPLLRSSPQLLYPSAKSAIVVSASYYTEVPDCPGDNYGRIARYAVGLDYHVVLKAKLRELKAALETKLGRPLVGKAYTDDVTLLEQGFANRSGLGFTGKHTLVIGPKMAGSYNFIAELFTDLEIEPDEKYEGTCGQCFRCGDICPTKAIVEPGVLDAGLCISYLTIENKGGIPSDLRKSLGDWVFGCDACQEICPYNKRPPETRWKEFQPESGVGHYVNLFDLLDIKTEEAFHARFVRSPVRRPKRRGLLRNALVVIGNKKPLGGADKIQYFIKHEEDPMLIEHAQWALNQY